ncbi:ATP-binding cassette domain-containing protein [Bacillus gobiensis]
MESRVQAVADGLKITDLLPNLIHQLSGGEKTKVGLAALLLKNPDILLLDEPTNHLDIEATEWLEKYLGSYKGTVVTISHDRYFLDHVTNKTIDLEDGEATVYLCSYSKFVKEKEKKLLDEFKEYEEQQKKIKK